MQHCMECGINYEDTKPGELCEYCGRVLASGSIEDAEKTAEQGQTTDHIEIEREPGTVDVYDVRGFLLGTVCKVGLVWIHAGSEEDFATNSAAIADIMRCHDFVLPIYQPKGTQ